MSPSPVTYTKITLRNIPAAQREIYHFTDRSWTWDKLLKTFLVDLDPTRWTIYDKSSCLHARLDDPIRLLVNRRKKKKNAMSVVVRKRKDVPTGDSTGEQILSELNSDGYRQPENSGQDEETDEQLEYDGFLFKVEESQSQSSSDYEHQRMDMDKEDDSLSQLSQEEDEDNEDGKYIKQQLIDSIQEIPTGELCRMRKELIQLKLSENSREYKWIHFAPRVSSFVMSAFRA